MTAPRRWEPDPNLVGCVLSAARSPIPMSHMSAEDRAWLVSGLTLAGVNANEIASMTRCSRRLVMQVRADPCTRVATAARAEAFEMERELRAERSRHGATRARLAEAEAEVRRLRSQRDRLVDSAGRVR